jgi:hypothetical protein
MDLSIGHNPDKAIKGPTAHASFLGIETIYWRVLSVGHYCEEAKKRPTVHAKQGFHAGIRPV